MNTCEIRFTGGRMVIHTINSLDEALETLEECQKYTVPFIKIRPIDQDVTCLYNLCNIISIEIFNDKGE